MLSLEDPLLLRARALKQVRAFFDARSYLEVDPPSLSPYASIDCYIDPIETTCGHFLHTSPEYAMKRILSHTAANIYFLGHVFRKESLGPLHNPEFTMIEWYKLHTTEHEFLSEVEELLTLFLGPLPIKRLSYSAAWEAYADTSDQIAPHWKADEIRHYLWATTVEPNLGVDCITLITDFPKEDSLLCNTRIVNGIEVGMRYEYYHNGIELANGFYELLDPIEQKRRLIEENEKRILTGKHPLPLDPTFIEALEKGLPQNTYGIAAGFDRLLMLQSGLPSIHHLSIQ